MGFLSYRGKGRENARVKLILGFLARVSVLLNSTALSLSSWLQKMTERYEFLYRKITMNEKDRCHWTSYTLMLYFVYFNAVLRSNKNVRIPWIFYNNKDLRFVLASALEFQGRNVTIGEWLNLINKLNRTSCHWTKQHLMW